MDYGYAEFLTLLGSLGLFLYGMKVMSDSLMKLAGDKMRNILARTTSNRVFALFTGFLITAAIQSSSATTLMVVSFVNASLLTLSEAVGVIMGANIGTTVTAWVISILGFKVKMSAIALPLVGAGFLLSVSKREINRQWGFFIIGFAVLFIGLQFLQDSMPDIRNNPGVLAFLAEYTTMGYLSVLLFLAIGTGLTLIVQSSSATMALTLLMSHEGWIPFDMAAAMVLGENIGTTVTANLAAMMGNYHARRAARAHFIFNIIGVVWILILFYPFINMVGGFVESIEGQSPFNDKATVPIALSLFHTSFNITNAVLLIGFVGLIVKVVERIVPVVIEKEFEIDEPEFLSESSMQYIQTGIKALRDESIRLLENAAYKVLSHGLRVHREDLESEQSITLILSEPVEPIPIDIDQIYVTQIKSIYGKILDFATKLQKQTKPSQQDIETIRNILFADRQLAQVVKRMKPLQLNLAQYMDSPNEAIRKEYNFIRRRILKVVRAIKKIGHAQNPQQILDEIKGERIKADNMDALLSGRVEELLYNEEITNEMASSLINDSASALRITKNLVDIATLLYSLKDTLVEENDS